MVPLHWFHWRFPKFLIFPNVIVFLSVFIYRNSNISLFHSFAPLFIFISFHVFQISCFPQVENFIFFHIFISIHITNVSYFPYTLYIPIFSTWPWYHTRPYGTLQTSKSYTNKASVCTPFCLSVSEFCTYWDTDGSKNILVVHLFYPLENWSPQN